MTKVPAFLLAALIALVGIFIVAVASPKDVYPGAVSHPHQVEMHVAGPAVEFDVMMIGYGRAVGVLLISIFLLCLFLGSGKNGNDPRFVGLVLVSGSLLIGAFLAMTSAMEKYTQSSSPELIGGFPVPTAWMVFGIWLMPIAFLATYVVGFRRWVMTEDDQQRLEALVAYQKAEI